MDRLKTIIVSLLLLLVTGATTGIPAAIHLCCDEVVEATCPPQDCCGDEEEDGDCCSTELEVRSIEEDASLAPCQNIEPISVQISTLPISTAVAGHLPATSFLRAFRSTHPFPPPDRAALSVYLI